MEAADRTESAYAAPAGPMFSGSQLGSWGTVLIGADIGGEEAITLNVSFGSASQINVIPSFNQENKGIKKSHSRGHSCIFLSSGIAPQLIPVTHVEDPSRTEWITSALLWSWPLREHGEVPDLEDAEGWVMLMQRPQSVWSVLWGAYVVAQIQAQESGQGLVMMGQE